MKTFAQAHISSSSSEAIAEVNRFLGLLEGVASIVYGLIFIAVALAFLWFFWGLAEFIREGGNLAEAKKKILWGLLAIFVLTSIWGIIYFFGYLFLGDNPGLRGDGIIQRIRLPIGMVGILRPGGGGPLLENGVCSRTIPYKCDSGGYRGMPDLQHEYRWRCVGLGEGATDAVCTLRKPGRVDPRNPGTVDACGAQGCQFGFVCRNRACVPCDSLSSGDPNCNPVSDFDPTSDFDPSVSFNPVSDFNPPAGSFRTEYVFSEDSVRTADANTDEDFSVYTSGTMYVYRCRENSRTFESKKNVGDLSGGELAILSKYCDL